MTANVSLQPARVDRKLYRPVSPPISLVRPTQSSQRAPRQRTPRSLWGTLHRSSVLDFASLQSPALAQCSRPAPPRGNEQRRYLPEPRSSPFLRTPLRADRSPAPR